VYLSILSSISIFPSHDFSPEVMLKHVDKLLRSDSNMWEREFKDLVEAALETPKISKKKQKLDTSKKNTKKKNSLSKISKVESQFIELLKSYPSLYENPKMKLMMLVFLQDSPFIPNQSYNFVQDQLKLFERRKMNQIMSFSDFEYKMDCFKF